MRTVWKYKLNLGETEWVLPHSHKVVATGIQDDGQIYIWVEQSAEPKQEGSKKTFHVVGTGHALPEKYPHVDHVGTVFMGPFVWHIYKCW